MDDKIHELAASVGMDIQNISHVRDKWHRASIIGRAKLNQDGSYISGEEIDPISNEVKIIFTVHNHVTGEKQSAWVNNDNKIKYQPAQIDAFIKRREKMLQETIEKKQEQLEYWTNIYNELDPNNFSHQYLNIKKISIKVSGVKTGNIVMYHKDKDYSGYVGADTMMYPLHNINGDVQCYQTIYYYDHKIHKRWRGSSSEAFFTLGEITDKTKYILIGEGFATVWAVWHLNKDEFVGIVAGDAHNLIKVTPLLYDKYKKHTIILLADNDHANQETSGNTGLQQTSKILENYKPTVSKDGKLINERRIFRLIPPVIDDKNTDWWDVWNETPTWGSGFIINIINGYSSLMSMSNAYGIYRDNLVMYTVKVTDKEEAESELEEMTPSAEFITESGHTIRHTKIGFPILVCSTIKGGDDYPIKKSSSWVIAKDTALHQSYINVQIDRVMLHSWNSLKKELLNSNWDGASVTKKGENIMYNIVLSIKPSATYLPMRPGWLPDRHKFGLANRMTNNKSIIIPFDSSTKGHLKSGIKQKGTLQSWKENVGEIVNKVQIAQLAYLIFGYAPIVKFASSGYNPIVMLKVNSGYGKSLLGRVIMSMMGRIDVLQVQNAAGAAGMENIFADFNDLPLFLDELTAFDDEALRVLAYLYGNGRGKIRGTPVAGESQEVLSWRGCAYATSEKTMAQLREEKDLPKENSGEEIRLLNLALDDITEQDLGILYTERRENGEFKLFDVDTASTLGRNLYQNYGAPLINYIDYLETKGEDYIINKINEVGCKFYEKYKDRAQTNPQHRVLKLLSEMLCGMYLLIDAGICDITTQQADELVLLVYSKWLINSMDRLESTTPLALLITFIQKQLGNAHKAVDNNPYNSSGWDGIVANGEYKSGTVPLYLDDKTPVGIITDKDKAGENVIIIFNKWVNAVMMKSKSQSNMSKMNLASLQKQKGLLLEVCNRENRLNISGDIKDAMPEIGRSPTGIKLSLDRLLEIGRKYGI